MKVEIPATLKADIPQTMWGKILSATPVVMAVVATMLAGLSTSEMTRAQYARSLAAQRQSKAGDQWSFFQAKRLRGALQRNTIDLLQANAEVRPLDPAALPATTDTALTWLARGETPPVPPGPPLDPHIEQAIAAVASLQPETAIARLLAKVPDQMLDDALRAARDRAQAYEELTAPVNQAIERLENSLPGGDAALRRDFIAARLRYTAQRDDREARLNQAIAHLYELQVHKSNILADRHHQRSRWFFLGMLAAQAGVIISTFAMAARQRNLLWTIAAVAGLIAVAFAIYVYLYI